MSPLNIKRRGTRLNDNQGTMVMTDFTPAALAQIEWIRSQYAAAYRADPPDTAWLAVGQFVRNGDPKGPKTVAVGFFQRSEMNDVRRAGTVSYGALRLIVLGSADFRSAVADAIVDFEDGKGFVLR